MDAPDNHPEIQVGTTKGPCVFVLKCILLGSKYDTGYLLNDLYCQAFKQAIINLQSDLKLDTDGNFGQDTRRTLTNLLGINIDDIPYSLLAMSDTALQPDGQSIVWPQGGTIIVEGYLNGQRRTSSGEICLFPPYMDWAGAHENPMGLSQGPSVLILKLLFALTDYFTIGKYPFNALFDDGFAGILATFQAGNQLSIDSCFGQEARCGFKNCFGRDLEDLPRAVMTGANTAIQPNGNIIAWPPQIILA
jgi:hypothetical protein